MHTFLKQQLIRPLGPPAFICGSLENTSYDSHEVDGTSDHGIVTLTCGVIIEVNHIIFSAVATKQCFVIVILIPVEGFNFEPSTFRMATHNA